MRRQIMSTMYNNNAFMYPYVRMLPVCYQHVLGSEILTKTPHGYIRITCEYKEKNVLRYLSLNGMIHLVAFWDIIKICYKYIFAWFFKVTFLNIVRTEDCLKRWKRYSNVSVCYSLDNRMHPLSCVAAGPRTRLNHLYSQCIVYIEGLERLPRRLASVCCLHVSLCNS